MGILLAIVAAIFAALAVVLTKAGLKDIDPTMVFAIQAVLILCITWALALAQGGIATTLGGLDRRTWMFLLASGVATTFSTVFSYRALKLADATLINPIERLSLVLVALLSFFFLKEKLPWQTIMGIILMAGGAIMVGIGKK